MAPEPTPDARFDLSESSEFTLLLLDWTDAWRQRITEQFSYASGTHTRLTARYEIDFPPDLVGSFVDVERFGRVNALIPLGTRDKHQLLNLTLAGHHGAPASLLYRSDTASIQREFLESLLAQDVRPEIASLLEAICVFTPGIAREYCVRNRTICAAVGTYLRDTIEWEVAPTNSDISSWLELTTACAELLLPYLDEPAEPLSSSENLAWALPLVQPAPTRPDQASALLESFAALLRDAAAQNKDRFLGAVAEYGRRYELIVETTVPLLEPATITVEEDRPLRASYWGWSIQRLALGDARRAHAEVRIEDASVRLSDYELYDLHGRFLGPKEIENARLTIETLSVYSSVADRPFYAELRVRLTPVRYLQWSFGLLSLLNLAAAVAILAMPEDDLFMERLAVLVVPTTLAATVTLVREQSGLAGRVLSGYRVLLAATMSIVWVIGLIQVTAFHPSAAGGSGVSEVPPQTRPKETSSGRHSPDRVRRHHGEGRKDRNRRKPKRQDGTGP